MLVTIKTSPDFNYPDSGHRRLELAVLESKPDLKSGDYPKIEPGSNYKIKYKLYSYYEVDDITFDNVNK